MGYVAYDDNGNFLIDKTFTGVYDGNDKQIIGLYINVLLREDDDEEEKYTGLFAYSSGIIKNLYLANLNITGYKGVGAIVGYNNGEVYNCHSSGKVKGHHLTGGLIGINKSILLNSSSTVNTEGHSSVAGLVGRNDGNIQNSFSNGIVNGSGEYIGGLTGWNSGVINSCYSSSQVSGDDYVGVLVGANYFGTVENSYSLGSVTGNNYVGGLTGINGAWGMPHGTILNSYSVSSVNNASNSGGLNGFNYNIISESYWNIETSGHVYSAGGTGKTTTEMKDQTTFENWDFQAIWAISYSTNNGYPYLINIMYE